MRKTVLAGALAALAVSSTALPVGQASAADATMPAWCAPGAELHAEALPTRLPAVAGCDLVGRRIHKGDLSLEVPERGTTVRYSARRVDGARSFSVASYLDGSVGIDDVVEAVRTTIDPLTDPVGSLVRPSPDPCAAGAANAYTLTGHTTKGLSYVGWYYNTAGDPLDSVDDIGAAGNALSTGHNDCLITTKPAAPPASLISFTTRIPGADGHSCTASTGWPVIGWRAMSADVLAAVCTWTNNTFSPPLLARFDMAFNTEQSWVKELATCGVPALVHPPLVTAGAYDLVATATHEWGHVYGLDHVPYAGASATQTMAESGPPCDSNPRTLGVGDLNGMVAIYGAS